MLIMKNISFCKEHTSAHLLFQLVHNINVAGLMLDTTWTIINHYVTLITTVVIHNIGIPLGLSFSQAENAEIYSHTNSWVWSRQSFKKTVSDQNMQHICCLKHLLVSLGKTKFSEQVGNLVSSVSNADF